MSQMKLLLVQCSDVYLHASGGYCLHITKNDGKGKCCIKGQGF